MEINSKDQIINYFLSGAKKNVFIGVENEKFLFQEKNNVRATYSDIKKVFEIFKKKFEWKEVKENENIVGLKIDGKSISLEPGNQIELSGNKLSNIHEVCSESYDFQNQLDQICKETGLKTMSIGYDPITKLSNAPKNPKQRYKLMTKEMPKGGKLSLNMMYQTSGTQINLDYLSEDDFKKKFKIISYLTPISIAIFANSTILENKPSGYLSYRSKVWQNTSRGGLPKIFLEKMDFEKYSDFARRSELFFRNVEICNLCEEQTDPKIQDEVLKDSKYRDENFVKDLALSSGFIRAAFDRQLGKPSVLHEGMSDLMKDNLV